MPRRNDIHRILIVGSGPIIIGQACEVDYSGAQACKALRGDGYDVVLINSNPATIMTDPELANRTYVEPLSVEFAAEVIRRERPDALLSTVGGQTGLNLAIALSLAPISSTPWRRKAPLFARAIAVLSAVWPPMVGKSANTLPDGTLGRSRAMIFSTNSGVMGSI